MLLIQDTRGHTNRKFRVRIFPDLYIAFGKAQLQAFRPLRSGFNQAGVVLEAGPTSPLRRASRLNCAERI